MDDNYKEVFELFSALKEKIESGQIKKQDNGLYRTSRKFPDCDKVVYACGKNAEELADNLIEKRDKIKGNIEIDKHMYFYKIAQEWFQIRILGIGLAKKNVANYRSLLNNHILPCFKNRDIREIRNNEVQMFINLKAEKYSGSTVKKIKDIIIAIFLYAEDNQYIERNNVRRIILPKCQKFENHSKDPVGKDELVLAIRATKNNKMMQLAVIMLYVYGLRTCELVNLEWQFVNFEEDYFRIEKSKYTDSLKIRNEEITKRYLPLSPTVKNLMVEVKEQNDKNRKKPKGDFIFIKKNIKKQNIIAPLDTTTFDMYFNTLTDREMEIANGATVKNNKITKYTGVRHFTPYAFRRGVVTRLNAMNYNDAITQMFIGHRPKEVKDRYYSKMNFEQDLRDNFKRYMDKTENFLIECFAEAYS